MSKLPVIIAMSYPCFFNSAAVSSAPGFKDMFFITSSISAVEMPSNFLTRLLIDSSKGIFPCIACKVMSLISFSIPFIFAISSMVSVFINTLSRSNTTNFIKRSPIYF